MANLAAEAAVAGEGVETADYRGLVRVAVVAHPKVCYATIA